MTDSTDEPQTPSVNADHNSNAVGSISAGGDISGNIHIGNVYQTPEDDLPLSSDEIENGLTRFAQFLPERAPVLQDSFSSIAKKLRATLGADQNSLSPALKVQREDGVDRMKLMCMEVTDISFRAMCLGQNPPPYDSRPPFLGLFAFHPKDREFFFGREALVQKLVARIKEYPFLAVLGASGSGKSSLVMAGLIPALEAEMSYLTPSSAPLSQLLAAKESVSAKTVFVIDQFEELFTHPHDPAERADFIHALLELTKTNRVVITMRADFWGEVAIYADLKQAMQEHQELIAPMTVDELHSAMEKQAAVVGLRFDPTLSESILAEVKGEPGAMPLLQHALWELWNRRHGLWIKAEEYQAFGGVKQAIASTAEEVYASCSDFERARVRDIFLRLTRLDESGEGRDTRRRVLIEELIPVNSDSSVTINLLDKLADARLIVKTDKDVEVAHEALIRHWSRLTEWLNEDRDNLRLREGVSESAREWENSNHDESLLNHRGGRLELALAMSKLPRYQLNPIEQAYLNACVALRHKEQREREKRLRWTVTASIAAAVIFLVLGSFGFVKSNEATAQAGTAQANANAASTAQVNEKSQADAASTAQAIAEDQKNIAIARQLAAQAQFLFDKKGSKQQTAVLLAIQSMKMYPLVDAALVLQNNRLVRSIVNMTHNGAVNSVAFSPDGKYVVSGSEDGAVQVWEATTGKEVASKTDVGAVISLVFSPDGKYVGFGGCDKSTEDCIGSVRVWEVSTGNEIFYKSSYGSLPVTSVAFSPDGNYIVAGGGDGTVCILNVFDGQEIPCLTHDDLSSVTSVAFSPDGRYIVSGSTDDTARIWEVMTGREMVRMKHDDQVTSVTFSPNGKYVVSGSWDATARVWEMSNGKEISRMSHDRRINAVAFSFDGKYVISGSDDNTARVWEVDTGNEISRMIHDSSVTSITFSSDGKYVVSGSTDDTARMWEAATGKEISRMTHGGDVNSVAFSPDGKYVVSGGCGQQVLFFSCTQGSARVWSTAIEQEINRATREHATFSPDGRYIVSGSSDNTTRIWEVVTGQEIARLNYKYSDFIVTFSQDGKYIVFGSSDNTLHVWDVSTGNEISRLPHDFTVMSAIFSPDGKYVVSWGWDKAALVWEAATGKEIARMTHDYWVNSVAFSPDSKYVISGSDDGTARVWEVATGKEIARMTHDNPVYSVAFSPDGKYVVSGSQDGTARVWESTTGKEISRMTHDDWVLFIAFSPNGKYVASVSVSGNIRIWITETGKEISRMNHDDMVRLVVFSSDEKYIVSGSNDGTARIWEVATGKEIALMTHKDQVYSVAFSPDGKYAVSGSTDGTVHVWLWKSNDLITIACSRVTRNLTRAEWKQYIGDALLYQAVCLNSAVEAESIPTP